MKYSYAKRRIKSGDILAWSGSSFFSNTVKVLTKSQYSHIGIAWRVNGKLLIVEALEGKGVRIFPAYRKTPFYFLKRSKFIFTKRMEQKMLSHIGDNYSWFGCVRGWLGFKTRKDNRFQCAEFVNYILNVGEKCETPVKIVTYLIENGARLYFVKKLTKDEKRNLENKFIY